MINPRFFIKKTDFLTLSQVLEITNSKLDESANQKHDLNAKIFDVATLQNGQESQITFLNSGQYLEKFLSSKAGFCFVEEKNANKAPKGMVTLINKNPYFAYAQIADNFYATKTPEFIEGKIIHSTAKIGEGTKIAPNAYIGKNVEIGKNCFVGPNACVLDGCFIDDGCVINAGAVVSFAIIKKNSTIFNGAKIGQDGFGFAHNNGTNHKIIQIGIVEIGENVEIGANTCVDRGAIENTVINDGVKIDNLCQIAHNVFIDKGSVIAGGTAVAGSAKIGKFVQIGGRSSIAGHISIGDGAKIAGLSGVMRDVDPMEIVAGVPSLPIKKWHRINTMLAKMIEKKVA